MLRITLAAVAALAFITPAHARPHHAFTSGGSDYYTNLSGHHVHRPMLASRKPAGASAHCRDGSWSFSVHHRGTCSHHGGVAEWE
ncbi:MAG: DUF3761 domain-containing protein [Caulobacteraceae bacterium]